MDKLTKQLPLSNADDQTIIARKLKINQRPTTENWSKPRIVKRDSVIWEEHPYKGTLNSLIGMTLKDALPILEREKYKVKYQGFGRVSDITLLDNGVVNLTLR